MFKFETVKHKIETVKHKIETMKHMLGFGALWWNLNYKD